MKRFCELLLNDSPVLRIAPEGKCEILDFDHLPFGLRTEDVSFPDFYGWVSNRALSIGRTHAKEILNALRVSQTNRYEIAMACRGLSLSDAYWLRQEGDERRWEDINLFEHPLSVYISGISLSGEASGTRPQEKPSPIHTPELTTFGVSAKGWFREDDGLYLYKIGKYELPADEILSALKICHLSYQAASPLEEEKYLTGQRREWIEAVGEKVVKSKLFTTPEISMVTFEEFRTFCGYYGLDAVEQAKKIDMAYYDKMQVADYILNNNDRHEQNWGFFMDNFSGRLTGFCPLFDHDHAFSMQKDVMSQTTREYITLAEAAKTAQAQCQVDLSVLSDMEKPALLTDEQWAAVKKRGMYLLLR